MNPTLSRAIEQIKIGKMVILIDDESRENEGDFVMAAEMVTPSDVNFMIKNGRGLVCLSLTPERVSQLGLSLMAGPNQSKRNTAFTTSIEARDGVTTGISASDRAQTVRCAVDPSKSANDIVSPGHVFPLIAKPNGVLERNGHTEGSVDLMKLAGLNPSAMICEIMNEDGSMARLPQLRKVAETHEIPIVSIQDIISYRSKSETLIDKVAQTVLPTDFGTFRLIAFRDRIDENEHLALICGDLQNSPITRIHSECLTGDALGSRRCDCGDQLKESMKIIQENGSGIIIYLRGHEGRGIGLANKIRAYALQDTGLDTVEANHQLGFKADLRDYTIAYQILKYFKIESIDLLTNNPGKISALELFGISINRRIPLLPIAHPENMRYLNAKASKLGHHIANTDTQELEK